MSARPTSRTVRDLAKKLAKHTDAGQLKRIRAVQRIVHLTRAPFTRAVLALRELEAEGFRVQREDLAKTFPSQATAPHALSTHAATGPESLSQLPIEDRTQSELLKKSEMPTSYPAETPLISGRHADEPFDSHQWWRSGRCLGVYGHDLDSRWPFLRDMICQLLEEGVPTVIPVRKLGVADQDILRPAAEVVDLNECPGGIEGFMAQLEEKTGKGGNAAVLLDPGHGLQEADHDALTRWVRRPDSRIRLIYAESYAMRGWTQLMDAMLTYAETVFLSPAKGVDLQAVGVPADHEVPTEPGGGIYCTEEGHIVPFGAPFGRSVHLAAHQANVLFGPCGHRPGPDAGHIVPMQRGDVLRFWSDEETDEGWTLIAFWGGHGVIRRGSGAEAEYQFFGYIQGVRGGHPELERADIDEQQAQELIHKFSRRVLRLSDSAVRLDLRTIQRDGQFLLYHQTGHED